MILHLLLSIYTVVVTHVRGIAYLPGVGNMMGSMLSPNRIIAKDVKRFTYCCYVGCAILIVWVGWMPSPEVLIVYIQYMIKYSQSLGNTFTDKFFFDCSYRLRIFRPSRICTINHLGRYPLTNFFVSKFPFL